MFGTAEQQDMWLRPLLEGEIRSAFAMTEPDVASSRRHQHRAAHRARRRRLRDERSQVVDHRARCTRTARIFIVMGKTDPDGPPHRQQSQILVPMDTPGVTVVRGLPVFGYMDHEGHAELRFEDVRVPATQPARRRGRRLRHQPRRGSGPGASTTACARSARPSGRSS